MSDEVSPDTDDLTAFESIFHKAVTVEVPEEVIENDALAPVEDKIVEESEEEFIPDPEPEPIKKKSRFQERIDSITAVAKQEERDKLEALRELSELRAQLADKKAPPGVVAKSTTEPSPFAQNEDGTPVYPLGEFDPQYLRAVAIHATTEMLQEASDKAEAVVKAKQQAEVNAALVSGWKENVLASKEAYPDFSEKSQELSAITANVNPQFGDYLANIIMGMKNGPDVLYHLATNLEETKTIINGDPTSAALALGRIEARYALLSEDKQTKRLKVSDAPEPPERLNKGTSVTKSVAADTDDLDAFSRAFFSKPRKRF